jgi:urease accessory protein
VAGEAHPAALSAARPPRDWAALPAHSAPALDMLAELHLTREARLFVS